MVGHWSPKPVIAVQVRAGMPIKESDMFFVKKRKSTYELFLELCGAPDCPESRYAYEATKRSFIEMTKIYYWEMPLTLRQWIKQQLRNRMQLQEECL